MQKNQKAAKIKVIEIMRTKGIRGRVIKTRFDLEPHEERTIETLSNFGYDVETVVPSNTPKSQNPDILMMGTIWEMKGPTTTNRNTIEKRFKKAIRQANGRSVFDLREVPKGEDVEIVKNEIMALFERKRGMRRIIMIENDEKILDISK